MAEEKLLRSADELSLWAEDEGFLDDSIIVSVDPQDGSLTLALRLLDGGTGDPRDEFRKTSERYLPFTMHAGGGAVTVEGELRSHAPFECEPAGDGEAFGLLLRAGDATVRGVAREWRIVLGEELEIPIVPALDPAKITFHGPGPITADVLRRGLSARSVEVDLYGNWRGSGQSMGSAFVRDVVTPPPIAEDARLSGAWRMVPKGAGATDGRGLWVSGQSLASSAYAIVERTSASDPRLVRALVETLGSLPAFAWASSGNRLVEDDATRSAWCDSPVR